MTVMNGAVGMGNQALASLECIERLLVAIREEIQSDPQILAVTDASPPQHIVKDFPYPGARRAIVNRTPDAPTIPVAGPGLLFPADANRIGGSIVNKAAAGLTLSLGDGQSPGAGTVWLAPNGGTWDFKLSGMVWCGNVYGTPDSGAISLSGASV